MRAFVTGASGFVGSYVVRRLLAAGIEVAMLTRPSTDLWRLDSHAREATRIVGDLGDIMSIGDRLRNFAPDTVFHCAWSGVAGAQRNRSKQMDANVKGTIALAELSRGLAAAFIGIGSQAEYGPHDGPIAEWTATKPTTQYGRAKLEAGRRAVEIARSGGVRCAWIRLFSTYGPRDNPEWLIPYLVRTLLKGGEPAVTSCEQLWDYLFVEDAAEAIVGVGGEALCAGVYNLGSGRVVPLRSVVEQIRDLVDPELPLRFGEMAYRPDQVMHLEADISKLAAATGWRPKTALDEGLARTVAWLTR